MASEPMTAENRTAKINAYLNDRGFIGEMSKSNFIYDWAGYFKDEATGIQISVRIGCYAKPKEANGKNYEVCVKVPCFEGSIKATRDFSQRLIEAWNRAEAVEEIIKEGGEF